MASFSFPATHRTLPALNAAGHGGRSVCGSLVPDPGYACCDKNQDLLRTGPAAYF
ncbi:hypothetical protein D3C73_1527250 [compost metagenome]